MESKKKELAKNTVIIGVGKMCTQFISFLLLPLYTAALSVKEYGIVDILNTYVSLLMPIFTLQLEQGIFRFLLDSRGDNKAIKNIISTVTLFMSIMSVMYAFIIFGIGKVMNIQYSELLVLNLITMAGSNILLQVIRGLGNNLAYSIGSFVTAITTILLNIAFILFFRWGATGMLLATAIANAVCCVFLCINQNLFQFFSIYSFKKDLLKQLLKYSIPLVPNTISWWVVSASDRTIVSFFLGIASNGLLSIAHKFSSMYNVIYNIFNLTWTESVALYMDDKDGESYMNSVLQTVFNLFVTANVGIIACMPFVFFILVDKSYYDAYYQIPIQMLAALFNVIAGLYSVVYIAKKLTNQIAKTTVLAAVINVGVHLLLIKTMGLYASSISSLIAYMVLALVRYKGTKKYKNLRIPAKYIFMAILSYVIVFVGYYSKNRILQLGVLIIVVMYALLVNNKLIKSCLKKISSCYLSIKRK